jgi:predicted nucleotidyltransferase
MPNAADPLAADLPVADTVRNALVEARERLRNLYGDRLHRLILYGSQARGDARPNSDVDLALVLEGPVDSYEASKQTSLITISIAGNHGVYISPLHLSQKEFANERQPIVEAVRQDGIDLLSPSDDPSPTADTTTTAS